MKKNKIAIVGCGWFGLPLASYLHQQGLQVAGTTTTKEKLQLLSAEGVSPFLLDLRKPLLEQTAEFLQEAATVIIAIPPSRSDDGDYTHEAQVAAILAQLSKDQRLIYISSTSVYPEQAGDYDEQYEITAANTGSASIWYAEQHVWAFSEKSVVVRFGGLLGYNRIPGKYFSGKEASGQHQPVNYIHRDDAVGLVNVIVADDDLIGVFNGVSPLHPTRMEVYQQNSRIFGFPLPTSWRGEGVQRIIVPHRATKELAYAFQYPNPLYFFE